MLFFDPTVDWSRDLLDPSVPDLFVVRSKTSIDSNAAWNDAVASTSWGTPWIEYAALDKEEHFINLTFFDTRTASRNEKEQIVKRSDNLDDGSKSVGWYRSTSPVHEFFATLQHGEYSRKKVESADCLLASVIQLQRRKSLPSRQTSESSKTSITFRRMALPRFKQALNDDWNYLLVELSNEISDMDITMEAQVEQSAERMIRDPPSDQFASHAETLRLYIVGSSSKLDIGQPSGASPDDQMKTKT